MNRYLYKTTLALASGGTAILSANILAWALDGAPLWLVPFVCLVLAYFIVIDLIADIGRED